MKRAGRTLALALAAVVALAAGVTVAAGRANARASSCHIPGGKVVASGRVAKLLAVPTPDGEALFACIRRSGRKIGLNDGFGDARVSGRWVAWQRPELSGQWRIAVHDLRSGRERLVDGRVAAGSLRLTTRGSIVWAQRQESSDLTPLYANELRRGGRLLDGGDVEASSVRLRGRHVSWLTADNVQHFAIVR